MTPRHPRSRGTSRSIGGAAQTPADVASRAVRGSAPAIKAVNVARVGLHRVAKLTLHLALDGPIDDVVARAQRAEQAGADAVSMIEGLRDPFVPLASIAAATSHVSTRSATDVQRAVALLEPAVSNNSRTRRPSGPRVRSRRRRRAPPHPSWLAATVRATRLPPARQREWLHCADSGRAATTWACSTSCAIGPASGSLSRSVQAVVLDASTGRPLGDTKIRRADR